jgi:hypothetical protein
VSDKNAAAQENGLKALNMGLEMGPPPLAQKLAPSICSAVVTECFKGRQKTIDLAMESLMLFAELESGAVVVEALVKDGFKHKIKKIVPVAVNSALAGLQAYGPQDFPAQLLIKAFPDLFQSADAKVRDAAKGLVVELRKWLGPMMDKQIESLRPAQIKELKATFDELPAEKPKPSRFTRSKQKVNEAGGGGGSGGAGGGADGGAAEEDGGEVDAEIDPYTMMEPQDVADKLPGSWMAETSDKIWKVRSEALDKLIALADTVRIKPGDFGPIVTVLKKMIAKDANVIVVAKAAQSVALLANGLRHDFTPYAKALVPTILAKFKEKKATVIQQLHNAMDHISAWCLPIKDTGDILGEALKSKIANAKVEALKWFIRAASGARVDDIVPGIKALSTVMMQALNDAAPEVRDLACHGLAVLELKVGERRMKPYLSTLDKIKTNKVAEFLAAEKEKKAAKPAAAAAAAAPASSAKAAPTKKTPARKPGPPATATPKQAGRAAAATPVTTAPKPAAPQKPVWTEESAIAAGQELLTDEMRNYLTHDNPKARFKAMTLIKALSDEALSAKGGLTYPLMACMSSICGAWARENNFQVFQGLFDVATRLSQLACFDSSVIRYVSPLLFDKLGDFKLQKSATACLDALCCASSVDTVFHAMYSPMETSKNAKAMPNSLKWMASAIEDFGLAPVFVSGDLMKALAKSVLNNKAAPVKKAGVVLLGTVYKHMARGGPEEETLTSALAAAEGLEGTIVQQVNEQFELVSNTKPGPYSQVPRMAGGAVPAPAAAAVSAIAAAPAAVSAASPAKPAANSSGPFLRNDQKTARANGGAWLVTAEHDKLALERLGKELMDCASIELMKLMTSNRQEEIVEAANLIKTSIKGDWPAVVDCLDVILKWVVLRMHDLDSKTLMSGLEVMKELIDCMISNDSRLESYEASFFLPAVVEKTGLSHEHAVDLIKQTIMSLPKVHPPSKLFLFLLNCISSSSSNHHSQRECMDLVAQLIRRQGLTVASGLSQHDLVGQVAVHLNDQEAPMRKVTGETIAALEARLGSEELLEMVHSPALKDQVAQVLAQTKHQLSPQKEAHMHAQHHPHHVSVPFGSPTRKWWDALASGDEAAVVDAIKGLCTDMDALAAQKDGADGTIFHIVGRLWPSRPEDGMRVRKYLVNGLLTIVSHRACAVRVEHKSVEAVVQSVLEELCGTSNAAQASNSDRQAFLKALNVMMFRLLENCRSQYTCQVLVNMLTAAIDPAAKSDYVPSKKCDLSMKCLVKLSKQLSANDPASIEGGMLGWEACIRAIDNFFTAHPPAIWKTRANDMPLKAVKTTLSHLCKALGAELLAVIDATVPATGSQPAIIRQYADLMLKAAKKPTATTAAAGTESTSTAAAATVAAASKSDAATNENSENASTDYMERLHQLRRRFGLDAVPIEEPDASAAQAASDAAEKKISELRARLQAVRAPYESTNTEPSSSSVTKSTLSVPEGSGNTAAPTAEATAASAESAQAQLAAIRERLAKFQKQ